MLQHRSFLGMLSATLVGLIMLVTPGLNAQDSARKPLTATIFNLPPYGATIAGEPVGMLADYFKEIALRSGLEITILVNPYTRMEKRLYRGETDLAIMMRSPDSESYGEPIAYVADIVNIAMPQPGKRLPTPFNMHAYTVTALKGGYFAEMFDRDGKQSYVPAENYKQAVKLLVNGRVDAMVGVSISVYHNLLQLGVPPEKISPPIKLSQGQGWLHRAHQSKDPVIDKLLQDTIAEMLEENVWERIRYNYIPADLFDPAEFKATN